MNWIPKLVLTILFLAATKAQQNYSGNSAIDCEQTPTVSPLYTCNGGYNSCRAFLIFTAKFPYNTVPSIATLTSSDQSQISQLNNVTRFTVFPEDQEVILPVNCSCSGQYYQASTFYQITSDSDTHQTIANTTFQGLSTCNALTSANTNHSADNLQRGDELGVPIRCACPTRKQSSTGTKFLLTYPIGYGDTLHQLSKQFNVSTETIAKANSLHEESSTIYPFTTILIPLPSEPLLLRTVSRGHVAAEPPLPAMIVQKTQSIQLLSIAGIAAGGLSLVILLALVFVFLFRKKRKHIPCTQGRDTKPVSPRRELVKEIARLDRNLKVLKFSEIKRATRNFASRNRLNRRVYRGIFKRDVLAIKKCDRNACNEVKVLHQINHFNIVKLHGFCEHEDILYLVYEYMENGSLQDWLKSRESQDQMSWKKLIHIALDIANGLLYLHKFTNSVHVHNNISSSNILLDRNLRAKIANLSLARTESSNFMNRVVATKGYIAPECLEAGPVTSKVDVFAFGVVLLEIITGKEPVYMQDCSERLLSTTIAAVAESQEAEVKLSQFINSDLTENGGMEYAIQIVKLSLSCLVQDAADRPDMVEVVSVLQKLQFNIQKPAQKTYDDLELVIENEDTFSFSSVLPSM